MAEKVGFLSFVIPWGHHLTVQLHHLDQYHHLGHHLARRRHLGHHRLGAGTEATENLMFRALLQNHSLTTQRT